MATFWIRPLVWRLSETPTAVWQHEIDRANAHVRVRRADITIDRQAIGWGRSVLVTAVDLFAPFSAREADREWRAVGDAVRTDIKLTERSSIDLVGAFGSTLNDSAFAARVRGYAGTTDLEAHIRLKAKKAALDRLDEAGRSGSLKATK